MIVFYEWAAHPTFNNVYGIAFHNIDDYKINRVVSRFYLVELKRKNGKNFRKLIWFTTSELSSFIAILKEKTSISKR